MEPIRVAVFGAGYWGTKLCKEYEAIETTSGEAKLAYIVDAYAPTLEAVKKEIHVPVEYSTDFKAVLARDDVDAVHIALPNELHYEVARAALESGKHVLLEKPIATTSRDAFKLVALSEELGLVLQVGHIFRFNNAINMVRTLIRQGKIGTVFYAKIVWATHMIPPKGRDIVFDLAPHPVDILNYLLNEWPSGVDAVGESYLRQEERAEETAFINLEFPDRVVANIYISWIQHGAKERSIRIVGEKGTIFCDALNQNVSLYDTNRSFEIARSQFPSSRTGRLDANKRSPDMADEPNNTISDEEYHFLDTIRGRGPQRNSAMVGARTVEVLEAITYNMRTSVRRRAQNSTIRPQDNMLRGIPDGY